MAAELDTRGGGNATKRTIRKVRPGKVMMPKVRGIRPGAARPGVYSGTVPAPIPGLFAGNLGANLGGLLGGMFGDPGPSGPRPGLAADGVRSLGLDPMMGQGVPPQAPQVPPQVPQVPPPMADTWEPPIAPAEGGGHAAANMVAGAPPLFAFTARAPLNLPPPVEAPAFAPVPPRDDTADQDRQMKALRVAQIAAAIQGVFGGGAAPGVLFPSAAAGLAGAKQRGDQVFGEAVDAANAGNALLERDFTNRRQVRAEKVAALTNADERARQDQSDQNAVTSANLQEANRRRDDVRAADKDAQTDADRDALRELRRDEGQLRAALALAKDGRLQADDEAVVAGVLAKRGGLAGLSPDFLATLTPQQAEVFRQHGLDRNLRATEGEKNRRVRRVEGDANRTLRQEQGAARLAQGAERIEMSRQQHQEGRTRAGSDPAKAYNLNAKRLSSIAREIEGVRAKQSKMTKDDPQGFRLGDGPSAENQTLEARVKALADERAALTAQQKELGGRLPVAVVPAGAGLAVPRDPGFSTAGAQRALRIGMGEVANLRPLFPGLKFNSAVRHGNTIEHGAGLSLDVGLTGVDRTPERFQSLAAEIRRIPGVEKAIVETAGQVNRAGDGRTSTATGPHVHVRFRADFAAGMGGDDRAAAPHRDAQARLRVRRAGTAAVHEPQAAAPSRAPRRASASPAAASGRLASGRTWTLEAAR